jgi:hypothetical protein
VGSHVNANTPAFPKAAISLCPKSNTCTCPENERLVAFLSDGAFEEQRGSDWAPRWWRHEDSGLVSPIMILNGRRIEQRTEMAPEGGADCFVPTDNERFDPIDIDGRDPAAFAWSILEMESRLSVRGEAAASGKTIILCCFLYHREHDQGLRLSWCWHQPRTTCRRETHRRTVRPRTNSMPVRRGVGRTERLSASVKPFRS